MSRIQPARGIHVDYSHWPLLLQWPGLDFQMVDMPAYIVELDALMARRQPFASVVIVQKRGTMDRQAISEYGAWVKRNKAEMQKYYLGCAFVFPGDVLRFLLSTILLAAPAAVPHEVFGDVDKAITWANRKMKAAGLAPSALLASQLDLGGQ